MKPPLPPGESQRLATLHEYQVLDTAPDQAYDDLALLAAQICEVSTAVISLVDENRQWFKSRLGINLTETSRDISFCTHTILNPDAVLEVPDARLDPRFYNSPLVVSDPRIRFYAGAPLVAPDGQALGALCVMDRAPRSLTADQLAALRALSRRVVAQLELGRQARQLKNEIAERLRAEEQMRQQFERLAASEQSTNQLLIMAEKSRRALLSVLEDEKFSVQKLRESEERFRQLAENIAEVFWMSDPATEQILYVSSAFEKIWGRTCESLYTNPRSWMDAIHPEDQARIKEATARRLVSGGFNEHYRILRPDQTQRWIRDRAFPVRNAQGEVYRIVGTAEDITERKHAELRTAVQHAITEVLSEATPLLDTARRILEVICRRLDWNLGDFWVVDRTTKQLRCVEIWHPPSSEFRAFAEVSRTILFAEGEGLPGRVWSTRESHWWSDVAHDAAFRRHVQARELGLHGAFAFPIKLRNQIFGVVEVFSNQSQPPDSELCSMFSAIGTQIGQFIERKQLEDQFRQAQKMEAMGTLAGGIAHDFNNVLGAIVGYTELAKAALPGNSEVLSHLQAVSKGSARAAALVRQILAFSRQQEQQRKPIHLWTILDEALQLLRATIPSSIEIEVSVVREGPSVLADPTQIHQVVMNLATNASHAMRDRPGRLGVALENVQVDEDLAASHPGLRKGRYLVLSVSDTGHGMDEATISRIFDPFFTTKAPGEGTGLGLAVVHGIMHGHDGVITVYSQPGEGTRFQLYFPAYSGETSEPTQNSVEIPCGDGERILVVDDEAPLALMIQKVLERLGYEVDYHIQPAQALAAVRAEPNKYQMVITDLAMPRITGTELAKHLLEIRPDLPIILTTGYSATLTPERVRALGIREMLLKPMTTRVLGEAVYRIIRDRKTL